MPNNYPELYPAKEKMLRIVFGTFWGDLSQREKLSEIKPPLTNLTGKVVYYIGVVKTGFTSKSGSK